jgi:hypothetical protein
VEDVTAAEAEVLTVAAAEVVTEVATEVLTVAAAEVVTEVVDVPGRHW